MIWDSEDKYKVPVQKILDQLRKTDVHTEDQLNEIKNELERNFKARYKALWNDFKVSRKRVKFEEHHSLWLDSEFTVNFKEDENAVESVNDNISQE